jgi:homoserine/homoserine lactone efflux protein
MTIDHFITYFLIVFIATISPGPSMLLALNHGVNHGIGKSIFSGAGNVLGNLLMALASITGLGIVLATSGMVFNCIKWLGILYLAVLGLMMILRPVSDDSSVKYDSNRPNSRKGSRLFLDGFVIAIGNPKGILFFTALFPQFIYVKNSSAINFLIIFITLAIVAFGCYMLYAVSGVKLNRLLRLKSFRKAFNRVIGSFLIGSGMMMAFSKK